MVADADGNRVLRRRVANDETALLGLINAVRFRRHRHTVLTLACRRLNVLWAMLRDQATYQATAPNAAAA